jgi:hypothetical protein
MDSIQHQMTQKDIDDLIDQAYRRIQSLYDYYQLSANDFDLFPKESPALSDSIRQIEETALLSYQEMRVICHKWIENHHLLFKRRVYFKRI